MRDFLSLKAAYKTIGRPGVFIMLAAEIGLIISIVLLILVLMGVIV